MSLLLLIGSYRARAVCTWMSHRAELVLVPAAVLGAVVAGGLPAPALLVAITGPLTVSLAILTLGGELLHRELDRAGVPCTSCDIEGADDARS